MGFGAGFNQDANAQLRSGQAKLVKDGLGGVGTASAKVGGDAGTSFGTRFGENVKTQLRGLGGAMAGVLAAAGATNLIGTIVGSAADFQEELSAIKAVSGATKTELNEIRSLALRIGKDTSFSATEAAQAITELTKAGVKTTDVLGGAADATVSLAAAGGVALPTAATIAANALNQFGLSGKDMARVADLVAGAANASAISVDDFGFSLQQVGAVARTTGLSFGDTTTAIALLGQAGIVGSDAGTSLKTTLLNLQPSTKRASQLFRDLGIITAQGTNRFFDAAGKVKSLAEVSEVLQDALKGQTDQQKLANLEILFGTDAIRAAAVLSREGAAGVNELSAAINKIKAADVARTRLDNFRGALEELKGTLETVAIQIGTPIIEALGTFARALANNLAPAIAGVAAAAAAAIVVLTVFNAELLLTIAVVAAPIALTGGFFAAAVYLYNKLDPTHKLLGQVKDRLKELKEGFLIGWRGNAVAGGDDLFSFFFTLGTLAKNVRDSFDGIKDAFREGRELVTGPKDFMGPVLNREGFMGPIGKIDNPFTELGFALQQGLENDGNFDFDRLGSAMGRILAKVIKGAVNVAGDLTEAVLTLLAAVDWQRVGSAFLTFFTAAVGGFIGEIDWGNVAEDIVTGLIKGLIDDLGDIGIFFGVTLPTAIFNAFTSALGIKSPSTVFAGFGGDIMQGLLNGLGAAVGGVLTFFVTLPTSIVGALPGLGTLLFGKGGELLAGLRQGAESGLGLITGFFASLPGRIVAALPDLTTILVSSGQKMMAGLAAGIDSGIGFVKGAIGRAAQEIKDHVPRSPAKKGPLAGRGGMEYAGQKIMAQLADGITTGLPTLSNAMSTAAGVVGGIGTSGPTSALAGANGSVVKQYNLTVQGNYATQADPIELFRRMERLSL